MIQIDTSERGLNFCFHNTCLIDMNWDILSDCLSGPINLTQVRLAFGNATKNISLSLSVEMNWTRFFSSELPSFVLGRSQFGIAIVLAFEGTLLDESN